MDESKPKRGIMPLVFAAIVVGGPAVGAVASKAAAPAPLRAPVVVARPAPPLVSIVERQWRGWVSTVYGAPRWVRCERLGGPRVFTCGASVPKLGAFGYVVARCEAFGMMVHGERRVGVEVRVTHHG